MKKMIVGAVCLMALVGCGVPMEGEEGAPIGTAQQELDKTSPVAPINPGGSDNQGGPQLKTDLLRTAQVPQPLQFQEQMHVTDPRYRGGCGH